MDEQRKKLEWEDKYSVGVVEIDNQHRMIFSVINQLVEGINEKLSEEQMAKIIKSLVEYKKFHFDTEENFFKDFNFKGAEEHIFEHQKFNKKLEEIQKRCEGDVIMLTFELVDFLEDWLVDHLLNTDQKYKECFAKNGLK